MEFSSFIGAVNSSFSFPGSQDEWLEDFPGLEPFFVASPVQLSETLPDLERSSLSPQPASSIYPPASPTLNAHTPLVAHDWHLPTGPHSIQHHALSFNPQCSGITSAAMPTTHQPPVTHNAGRSSMHYGLQGCLYTVVNGSSSVRGAFYPPSNLPLPSRSTVPSQYNDLPMFVDQTQSYNFAIETGYQEVEPEPASVTLSSSSIPSDLAFQPLVRPSPLEEILRRNSRGDHFVTSSPHHSIRRSSLPVQSVSPQATASHTCQWMRDDGTICAAPITRASVPRHLTTHGVTNMAHDLPVPCRWWGCRMRGNKVMMKRESVVRHVREKHLGYRRSTL